MTVTKRVRAKVHNAKVDSGEEIAPFEALQNALQRLRGTEEEPCYLCGHAFADHEFPESDEPYCVVGSCFRCAHSFTAFPRRWGDDYSAQP